MADHQASIALSSEKKWTLLDCTLRDGGYYNDWDFSLEFAQHYLFAAAQAGIDIVEIGFRHADNRPRLGRFASSHDALLRQLDYPAQLKVAVMTNLSDLISESESLEEVVHRFFAPSQDSPVSWARIAAHFNKIAHVPTVVDLLHDLGYRVGVNLMQIASRSQGEIEEAARLVGAARPEVLYFADSLGNLHPSQIERITRAFFQVWPGEIGFHAHNNRGLALANTLAAADCGVTWLDGTLMGMGRGAGNCPTEFLLTELQAEGLTCSPHALHPFIDEQMLPLMKQYQWGPNLLYSLAAQKGAHPTYIQKIMMHANSSGVNVNVERVLALFDQVENISSFQKPVLESILGECFQAQTPPDIQRKAG